MSAGPKEQGRTRRMAEDQAAAWFARGRRGLSPQDETARARWLAADPTHESALEDVEAAWARLGLIRAEPEIVALREAVAHRGRHSSRPWLIAASIAAATVLSVAVPRLWSSVPHLYAETEPRIAAAPPTELPSLQQYRTAVGETRPITLADGSVVTLDTDSAVRIATSDRSRLVILARGRAFFQVAKDPARPFIVFAGSKRVMAVGTAFDVRLDGDAVSVTLREGRVRVEAPIALEPAATRKQTHVEAADMVPGTRLDAPAHSDWRLAKADIGRDLAWLHGQIVFDGDRLDDAVAEMNRYSPRKIVLADSALASLPVSGVFDAGQVDAFARALQSYKLARIAARTTNTITLVGR